jgi:hypothetical protein
MPPEHHGHQVSGQPPYPPQHTPSVPEVEYVIPRVVASPHSAC